MRFPFVGRRRYDALAMELAIAKADAAELTRQNSCFKGGLEVQAQTMQQYDRLLKDAHQTIGSLEERLRKARSGVRRLCGRAVANAVFPATEPEVTFFGPLVANPLASQVETIRREHETTLAAEANPVIAQADKIYVDMGARTINEVNEEKRYPGPETTVTGPIVVID